MLIGYTSFGRADRVEAPLNWSVGACPIAVDLVASAGLSAPIEIPACYPEGTYASLMSSLDLSQA